MIILFYDPKPHHYIQIKIIFVRQIKNNKPVILAFVGTHPNVSVPQAEENLGMVMIFTLVTTVQEKLNEIVDVMKNRRVEEQRRKEAEAEEAEKVGPGNMNIYI